MAGTGMHLYGPTKSTEQHLFADVGSLGYRTNYGNPLGPQKTAKDRNVESVNDIGLITGSHQDLAANDQATM